MGVGGASACTACPVASLSGTDPRAASRSPGGRFRIPLAGDTSISARFEGADPQRVLSETAANLRRVVLVRDQGVYCLAERDEQRPDGGQKFIA
jgi:hypothetical protein